MTKLGLDTAYPVDCSADGIKIDFDVVARKDDLELLQDAVLEILDALRQDQNVTRYFGPACDKLLEKRSEAT